MLSEAKLRQERRRTVAVIMRSVATPAEIDAEGFGLTTLEPAIDAIPVLAAAIEGITDAVRKGETGYRLPTGDVAAWTDKARGLLFRGPQEREAFARRAWQVLAENYSWRRVAEDTVSCYRRAIEKMGRCGPHGAG